MPAPAFELEFNFRNRRFRDARFGLIKLAQDLGQSLDRASPIVAPEMKDVLDTVAAAMRQRHSTRWRPRTRLPAGTKGGKLATRSGATVRRIENSVRVVGRGLDDVEASIAGPRIHELGGVITPRRSRYLAIPLDNALNFQGVPLRPGPRFWKDTFVRKSRKGNLIIFQKRGPGKIVPLYLLKKRVRIPARLGLQATLDTAVPLFQEQIFDRLVQKILASVDQGVSA